MLAQTDGMEWQKTEERLYQDLGSKELKITADNTFAYEAINRLTGGYELAACGALVILFGMFLLIYNVMKISMNRDIQQMGLLYTIGTTKRQIKRIYFRQILAVLLLGVLLGSLFSGMILYPTGWTYSGSSSMQSWRSSLMICLRLAAGTAGSSTR